MSENEKKRREQKRAILSFCLKLTTVCLMLWAVFTFLIGVTQMKGESMYPRIRDGDVVLSYRLERKYAIGDVVTFQVNDIQRIARVTAMEGDIVEITPEGQLMVNGSIQEEEIFYPTEEISGGISYPYTVEADSYFLLCDFRTASSDSRSFGAVSKKDIDGKVITILRRRGI
jgi:signal peptidase I